MRFTAISQAHIPTLLGNGSPISAPFAQQSQRLIIVGGTGLYFAALTEGLAAIPPTPPEVRTEADRLRSTAEGLAEMIAALDAATAAKIDLQNPMRVQRAYEVLKSTGRSLATWQAETPAPDMPLAAAQPIVLQANKDWLNARIERRFDLMLEQGALAEAEANLADWSPDKPSSKAIGAPELIAHLKGEISLKEARSRAIIASRQYAKRQRTWFRARMGSWHGIPARLTQRQPLHSNAQDAKGCRFCNRKASQNYKKFRSFPLTRGAQICGYGEVKGQDCANAA